MLVVKRYLTPSKARQVAEQHNKEAHNGVSTAQIEVDERANTRVPRYKVVCPACKSRGAQLKAQVDARLEALARLTDRARISKAMQQWLRFQARFHKYSPYNTFLILSQRPDATLVAGYRKWQKMGRQVRKGEKGIKILVPRPYRKEIEDPETGEVEIKEGIYFTVGYVFDVSQTEGDPLPGPPAWVVEGEAGAELARRLEVYATSLGIEVAEDDLPGTAQGVSEGGKIVIRRGKSPLGRASTLAHEIAHELMHQRDQACLTLPRRVREVEAEAVAFVVLAHFGHEPPEQVNYVALWDRDGTVLRERMERIADTARTIIEALEGMEEPIPLAIPAGEEVVPC